MSTPPLADDDAAALARLFERVLGHGFRLVVIELRTPVEREALTAWLSDLVLVNDGQLKSVDLRTLAGANLWAELHQALDPLPPRAALLLYGLEVTERRSNDPRAGLLQQLNVQRDVLVRDFAVPWVVVLHPTLFAQAMEVAPDFLDYAVRRVVAPVAEVPSAPVSPSTSFTATFPPLPLRQPIDDAKRLVAEAWDKACRWDLAGARDRLSRLELRGELGPEVAQARQLVAAYLAYLTGSVDASTAATEFDKVTVGGGAVGGVSALLAAEARLRAGVAEGGADAVALARAALGGDPDWVAMIELGAMSSDGQSPVATEARLRELAAGAASGAVRALALSRLADILFERGEVDEALRIRREEQLPLVEAAGNPRELAVTWGQIADGIETTGAIEESMRIRREQELPVYERLGASRDRALTLRKIADLLRVQGDLDEAMRLWRAEVIPTLERVGDRREVAVTYGRIADVIEARGDVDEALRLRREQEFPVYQSLGDRRNALVSLSRMLNILQTKGEWDAVLKARVEQEIPAWERLGFAREKAIAWGKVADILEARGEHAEAFRIRNDEVLPVLVRAQDARERAVTFAKIAGDLAARGEPEEAIRVLRQDVLPVFERLGAVRDEATAQGLVADALLALGDTDAALRVWRDVELPVYERLGAVRDRSVVLQKIAGVLANRGDLDEAVRLLRDEVLPPLQRMSSIGELCFARWNLATLLRARRAAGGSRDPRRDKSEARELLRAALRDAERLGLPEAEAIRRELHPD